MANNDFERRRRANAEQWYADRLTRRMEDERRRSERLLREVEHERRRSQGRGSGCLPFVVFVVGLVIVSAVARGNVTTAGIAFAVVLIATFIATIIGRNL